MVCQSDWLPMIMATDFAPGGAKTISCAKEAPDIQHDPEKWKPVFRKDHAPLSSMIRKSGNRFSAKIMLHQAA
jgi:hypothetical protein